MVAPVAALSGGIPPSGVRYRIGGRGERRLPLRYNENPLLDAVLRRSPFRAVWSKAVEMAGWRPLPPQKPRARFNGTTFKVRAKGFKTLAQICEASGVPNTTLRRWLGNRVPELPLIDGIRAVADEDFAEFVEVCRREYLATRRTRKKVEAVARRRADRANCEAG